MLDEALQQPGMPVKITTVEGDIHPGHFLVTQRDRAVTHLVNLDTGMAMKVHKSRVREMDTAWVSDPRNDFSNLDEHTRALLGKAVWTKV